MDETQASAIQELDRRVMDFAVHSWGTMPTAHSRSYTYQYRPAHRDVQVSRRSSWGHVAVLSSVIGPEQARAAIQAHALAHDGSATVELGRTWDWEVLDAVAAGR